MEPNTKDASRAANLSNATSVENLTTEKATESNALEIPTISLPKGGGALKGIDEKFTVNTANGTSALEVPLPITPARNGFSPAMGLNYNSGSGNGIFGLGWSIDFSVITRKTDKGIPRYTDEDVFMFSGADDLIPFMEEETPGNWTKKETVVGALTISRYRPRITSDHSKIEKIAHPVKGIYWRVIDAANTVTIYGRTPESRIADPTDPQKIYSWLPEFSFDDKGNWIIYEYKAENFDAVPNNSNESNRLSGIQKLTNRYLKRVRYFNAIPYFVDAADTFDPPVPLDPVFHLELVLDYGEHDLLKPTVQEIPGQFWNHREDPFSTYRSGFEIRTYRRCERVLMFHHFPDELQQDGSPFGTDYLVRSLSMGYRPSGYNGSGQTEVNYLGTIMESGYVRKPDGSYAKKSLPPLDLQYEALQWSTTVMTAHQNDLVDLPTGLQGDYRWTDLFGEGISGILSEQAEGWYYKHNLGDVEGDGNVGFEVGTKVMEKPSFTGLQTGKLTLVDLDADGKKQLVSKTTGLQGYFEVNDDNGFNNYRPFEHHINIDFGDPNVKLFDITGNGKADIVMTEERVITYYEARGRDGYKSALSALKSFGEEEGPAIVFADGQNTIFLADMTGDGLTDIVRVRNGETCYWANMGYGRYSAKVAMQNAPWFDHPDKFDPKHIHLNDISGTGTADVIYKGADTFKAFLNLGGNGFSDVQIIDPFFPIDDMSNLKVVDLLGKGTACLVWSSGLPSHSRTPLRYIDLMSGKKPHVLVAYDNNMGMRTQLGYKSSTHFYLKDKREGTPWITKLPFPVQVVENMTVTEDTTNVKFTTKYVYRHGYYDHGEREFRGFGLVEQTDTEHYSEWKDLDGDNQMERSEHLFQKPVLTKTWFHTGAFIDQDKILDHYNEEHWYNEFERHFPGVLPPVGEPILEDALLLPSGHIGDVTVMERLRSQEFREAARACKGMVLRTEVFTLDAPDTPTDQETQLQLTPHSVATHNCHILLQQPLGPNRHACFQVIESEAFTIQYERDVNDPRISHSLNLEIDRYGNVLQTAKVAYARKTSDATLPQEVRDSQSSDQIVYTKNTYTNDVFSDREHRLRLPFQNETFEITELPKMDGYYKLVDFVDLLGAGTQEISYTATPSPGVPQRRKIEHFKQLYYKNDLSGPLAPGVLESKGIDYESYVLAFTPEVLTDIFGGKLAADFPGTNGFYVHFNGDADWWVPSGTIQYIDAGETVAAAQNRFYVPLSFSDAAGARTQIVYYKDYAAFTRKTINPLLTETTAENYNFRTLAPTRLRDGNDNLKEVIFDELGMPKAMALLGKDLDGDGMAELEMGDDLSNITEWSDGEAALIAQYFQETDSNILEQTAQTLLQRASVRYLYDLEAFMLRRKPMASSTLKNEQHHSQLNPGETTPLRIVFEYSSGSGSVIMAKAKAEPGVAKSVVVEEDLSYTVTEMDTTAFPQPVVRWVGNGRTVLNNKGNPVKQYEPFFSVVPQYEDAPELIAEGVTTVSYYDSLSRLVKVVFPDRTFSEIKFDAWQKEVFDRNDTITDSGWYTDRINNQIDAELLAQGKDPAKEKSAAEKAAIHFGTPSRVYFDVLGRAVLTMAHNRKSDNSDEFIQTTIAIDIEGNTRSVTDARNNTVMEYRHDMLGHRLWSGSMDAGERWNFFNALGRPIRRWDQRDHIVFTTYDVLQRVLTKKVTGGDGAVSLDKVYEKNEYGEGAPNDKQHNLRGKLRVQFDTAGKITYPSYDFKGNLLKQQRQFLENYKTTPDWSVGNPDLLLQTAPPKETQWTYDALNRVTLKTNPDGSSTNTFYNEAGLLREVRATQNGATQTYVKNIGYNVKGQRESIVYGNDVRTAYAYDSETFRLHNIRTNRIDNELIQDLYYTYDPVGNIVETEDRAIPTVFFGNHRVVPRNTYTYDAIYRLIVAEGKEHIGQATHGNCDQWNDLPFMKNYSPGSDMEWRNYTQRYAYDLVGNIMQMRHIAINGNWTRNYDYAATNNRLLRTNIGANTYNYSYHPLHGNITDMPHLATMDWNFRDELSSTASQTVCTGKLPETTYYVYDGSGKRVRKITENQSVNGNAPTLKEERQYLGDIEVYLKFSGTDTGLERTTLHISDDQGRIAMIDTRNGIDDGTDVTTTRYQLGNRSNSASIELDGNGAVIGYEEFHPFGTTAYQAVNASIKAAAKRYRYTGMERDTESGLGYHNARYYIPWLGRWLKPDPVGLSAGVNLYAYVNGNPIKLIDPNGTDDDDGWGWGTVLTVAAVVTVAVVVTVATAGVGTAAVAGAVGAAGLTGGAATAATATGAVVVAGASGALGSVAATGTSNAITGRDDSLVDAAVSGGVAGVATLGVGAALGAAARSGGTAAMAASATGNASRATNAAATVARAAHSPGAVGVATRSAGRATMGAVAGGVGGATQETTRQVVSGEYSANDGFDTDRIAESTGSGALMGAALGPVIDPIATRAVNNISTRAASLGRVRADRAAVARGERGPGPARSASYDPATRRTFEGRNEPYSKPIQDVLQKRMNQFSTRPDADNPYFGRPGQQHAEINSTNDALTARASLLQREMTPWDLAQVTTSVRRSNGSNAGEPFRRCPRCEAVTEGMSMTPDMVSAESTPHPYYSR